MSTPIFQMSADARLIYQRLVKIPAGSVIRYAELEREVSRPLSQIRGAIAAALRRALREDRKVFVNVRGEGYLCCPDEAIVDNSTADTSKVRRAARRAVAKLTMVENYAALPQPKQLEHTTRLSILAAVAAMTREASINKVRSAAQGRSSELPLAETVRLFSGM